MQPLAIWILPVLLLIEPVRAASPDAALATLAGLDRLLATARLGTVERLSVPRHATVDRAWSIDGLVGVGRTRRLADGEQFEQAVLADIAELQFRCGALDSEIDLPGAGADRIAVAMLDCRASQPSVIAAIYTRTGRVFTSLLQEGAPTQRDRLLDKRARLMRALDTGRAR
jgi:hypothetical protein